MSRSVVASVGAVLLSLVVAGLLLPFRDHVSIATDGLVLVVPVVVGVSTGGLAAGLTGAVAGFLVYDLIFIPPYYTLSVGAAQNWVALVVYAAVVLIVAQVVARLKASRAEEQRRATEAQRLLELSELLVTDRSLTELLQSTVDAVFKSFDVEGVALLLPQRGTLAVAVQAGVPFAPEELQGMSSWSGRPVPVGAGSGSGHHGDTRAMALSTSGRPVGILALRALPAAEADRHSLQIFANQAALTIERAQLRKQALRSELLEETDRFRRALLGAVSHDLRTPLATMKVASTTLLESEADLARDERRELYGLIESQTDRLSRLVTGLLDVNRYEAGALELRAIPVTVAGIIDDALAGMRPSLEGRQVRVCVEPGLPQVCADPLLIGQVLVNLIDNADRHAPPGSAIVIEASRQGAQVRISVADRGPGVPPPERESVFDSFVRSDSGGRAGLGLWISRAFVAAHGQRIWVEDAGPPGARLSFTLEVAA